jgi:hypothetical protein
MKYFCSPEIENQNAAEYQDTDYTDCHADDKCEWRYSNTNWQEKDNRGDLFLRLIPLLRNGEASCASPKNASPKHEGAGNHKLKL